MTVSPSPPRPRPGPARFHALSRRRTRSFPPELVLSPLSQSRSLILPSSHAQTHAYTHAHNAEFHGHSHPLTTRKFRGEIVPQKWES